MINVQGKRMVRNKKVAQIADVQNEVVAVKNELEAKSPRAIESMGYNFNAFTVDAENQVLDITGILDSLVLLKTNSCGANFVAAHGDGTAIEMDSGSEPLRTILAKGCFLLVDDRNASDIKYTILVTGNTLPEIGKAPDSSRLANKVLHKIGNNDFKIDNARVFKLPDHLYVPNEYLSYTLKAYGVGLGAASDIRVISISNTGAQSVSNISSEMTKVCIGEPIIKYQYVASDANQPNLQIPVVPSVEGTYVLKASVDSNGVVTGFSWVAE